MCIQIYIHTCDTHTHTHTHTHTRALPDEACSDHCSDGLTLTGEVCGLTPKDVWRGEGGSAGPHVLCAVLATPPPCPPSAADDGQVSTQRATTCH